MKYLTLGVLFPPEKVPISFFRFLEEQVKGSGWSFSILNLQNIHTDTYSGKLQREKKIEGPDPSSFSHSRHSSRKQWGVYPHYCMEAKHTKQVRKMLLKYLLGSIIQSLFGFVQNNHIDLYNDYTNLNFSNSIHLSGFNPHFQQHLLVCFLNSHSNQGKMEFLCTNIDEQCGTCL